MNPRPLSQQCAVHGLHGDRCPRETTLGTSPCMCGCHALHAPDCREAHGRDGEETFACDKCGRLVGACLGQYDDQPDTCDDCYSAGAA